MSEILPQSDAELLRLLVDTVEDYAIFVLSPAGEVLTWNRGAQRLKGYAPEEIIGQHFSRFYRADDLTAGRPARHLVVANQQGRVEDEGWRVRKDGTTFWANVVITALRGADGELRGFAKVTRDLTERHRLEEAERHARLAAEEASRLKDEFLATVSHELRTPLNVMTGTVWRMHRHDLPEHDYDRALDALDRNLRLMTRLVEDLLDVSRLITGKLQLDLQPIELGRIVENTIEVVAPTARTRQISIRSSVSASTGLILGDEQRLQQILSNLMTNAIKFSDAGSQIDVRLGRRGVDVVLQVSDTGRGIAPEFLPRIFERFTQQDAGSTRQFGGLGLGLAVVKHLAEAHGGRVAAFSEGEGRGASFEVYFPVPAAIVSPTTITSNMSALGEQLPQLVGVRVLVVDDQRDAREMLCAILKHSGAHVTAVPSATDALRIVEQFRPDVVLADIAMPQTDGYAFIRQIRTQLPEDLSKVPAAALTAFAGTEDRLRVLSAGYQLHIAKPVDPIELLEAVTSLVSAVRDKRDLVSEP